MAQFKPRLDIWEIDPEERHKVLQPGQHVMAGSDGPHGAYLGGSERSDVVAWKGNAEGRYRSYHRALRTYAKGMAA